MSDQLPHPETGELTNRDSSHDRSRQQKVGIFSRITRWQKVVGITAVLIVVAFVVLQLTGVDGGLDHVPQPGPPPGGH